MNEFRLKSCLRKRRFENKKTAKQVIVRLRRSLGNEFREQKIYFCEFCSGYHLTSRVEPLPRIQKETLWDTYLNSRPLTEKH